MENRCRDRQGNLEGRNRSMAKKHNEELGYEAREDGGEAGGSIINGTYDLLRSNSGWVSLFSIFPNKWTEKASSKM